MDCSVCGEFLEDDKAFPEDFPDEWKFCCFCKIIAKKLINEKPSSFVLFRDIAILVEAKITLAGKQWDQ